MRIPIICQFVMLYALLNTWFIYDELSKYALNIKKNIQICNYIHKADIILHFYSFVIYINLHIIRRSIVLCLRFVVANTKLYGFIHTHILYVHHMQKRIQNTIFIWTHVGTIMLVKRCVRARNTWNVNETMVFIADLWKLIKTYICISVWVCEHVKISSSFWRNEKKYGFMPS